MLDLVITSRMPERKNCLGCAKYLACKDARKSVLFACDRFSETLSSKKDAAVRLFDFGELDFNRPTTDDMDKIAGLGRVLDPYAKEKAFDINKVIDDIILNDEVVSSDIKIADRDFPQAPNFYTFCVSDKYLNQKPFIEQALIGTIVLAEYCPRCSDMEWINHTHKVDDSLHRFERRVALLDKGVCPYCHKTKSYFARKGELNFYNEAALSVGQRGGKSAWLGMMAAYLTHWQLKLQKPNEVYGLLRANILHGTFAALTYAQAKDTLWEPYYGHLTDSPFFCLAEGTKITIADGSHKNIENVSVGDSVLTYDGHDVVTETFDNGVKECFELTLCDESTLIGTAEHKVQCLGPDGASVVWKNLGDLTNEDYVLTL